MPELLLGIDIGTSSVKVSVVDSATAHCLTSARYPESEATIISSQKGWAEQSPQVWWAYTLEAIKAINASGYYDPADIKAIGIAYQMHGLVLVDKNQEVLRDSIIWCDSRAVDIGNKAFEEIGTEKCLTCLLNSPGNFTASKLSWVKINEPGIFNQIDKIMLPGDFIAMKLTGEITTTVSALSEGIFWDFKNEEISKDVMNYFEFNETCIPTIQSVFSPHGFLKDSVAMELSLDANIPVAYKAGDQLNNALSLNVFNPGEVAATAGTSGVIYAVTDKLVADKLSRVNTFAHVNYSRGDLPDRDSVTSLGVLLCINGTGIMNSWIKKIAGDHLTYDQINMLAADIAPGCEGLFVLPFGNGAERMFQNKLIGAHVSGIDLNNHSKAQIFRGVQEGIAFAFRYGLEILQENGINPTIIRAGASNLFLSEVFIQSFVNIVGIPLELYANDGSAGAALGAGVGAGIYKNFKEAFSQLSPLRRIAPDENKSENQQDYLKLYSEWKNLLNKYIN